MDIGSATKLIKALDLKVKGIETSLKGVDPKALKSLQDAFKGLDPKALDKLKDMERKQADSEKWFMSTQQSAEQKTAARITALEKKLDEVAARVKALEDKPLKDLAQKQTEMMRMLGELTKKYNETAKQVVQSIGR